MEEMVGANDPALMEPTAKVTQPIMECTESYQATTREERQSPNKNVSVSFALPPIVNTRHTSVSISGHQEPQATSGHSEDAQEMQSYQATTRIEKDAAMPVEGRLALLEQRLQNLSLEGRPIQFALFPTESKYTACEQELLAIVHGIQKF
jgi:hypothetical protein